MHFAIVYRAELIMRIHFIYMLVSGTCNFKLALQQK